MYWWRKLYRSTLPIAEPNQSIISIAITGYLKPSYAHRALGKLVEAINNRLTNNINQQGRPTEMSKRIIDTGNSVAMEILPPKSKTTTDRQLWKNDAELNQLIEELANLHIGAQQYKNITKNIKKRVKRLRNEKLRI